MYWTILTILLALTTSVFGGGGCPTPEAPLATIPNSINLPLLDSFSTFPNYGPFIDLDGDQNEWSLIQPQLCNPEILVCNGSASQDNWVVIGTVSVETTVRISSVNVIVDFLQNCSNTTCFGGFGLYRFDHDETGDVSVVSNYANVSTSLETGVVVPLTPTNTRLSLALRDTGTCVTVTRVRVYYSNCVNSDPMPFVMFPAEVPFGSNVNGTCITSSLQTGDLLATCSADGVYSLPQTPCECGVGYSGADGMTCTECVDGFYKPTTGNGSCTSCPTFSETPDSGRSNCTCNKGHTRADSANVMSACDECVVGYFRNSTDGCLPCPSGSTSVGGSVSSCTCGAGLTTSSQNATTSHLACDRCRADFYRSSSSCADCPANSNRMFSDAEGSCSCSMGRLTASGQNTTTGEICGSCALTHFLSSGMCEVCPARSRRLSEAESSCTCELGYVITGNQILTTTEDCQVIVGFVVSSATFQEGSESRMESVKIELAAVHNTNVAVMVYLDGDILSTVMFPAWETSMDLTFLVSGDEVALENNYTQTLSIKDGTSFIVGGSVDAKRYYRNVTIKITEDDAVSVGFTGGPRVTFNETQGMGMVSLKRIGDIAVPLVLLIVNSNDAVINVTQPQVTFNSGTAMEELNVEFEIYDNNVGGQVMRSSQLSLKLVEPKEFNNLINFADPTLSETVTVVIVDDDVPPPPFEFTTEVIIGISVGGVVVVLAVLLIIIICICICRLQSVNRQGFYTTYEDKSTEPPRMLRYSASLRSITSQTIVPVAETQSSLVKENEFYV